MSTSLRVPNNWGTGVALVVVGTVAGFFLGRYTASNVYSKSTTGSETRRRGIIQLVDNSSDEDDDEEEEDQADLKSFKGADEEWKLILVVRTDLGMTKGKIAAQCSHATLACYKTLQRKDPSILKRWEARGQAKVSVQAKSEDELLLLQAQAMSLGLCAQVIHDAGRTQIASGSATVLGVGPGPKSVVDQVTGGLKLL